jgi:hypothetical protein
MPDQPADKDETAATHPSRDDPVKALTRKVDELRTLFMQAITLQAPLMRAAQSDPDAQMRLIGRHARLRYLLEAVDVVHEGIERARSQAQPQQAAAIQRLSEDVSRLSRIADQISLGEDFPAGTTLVPVSIYLSDERIHEEVEAAVEHWLAIVDVSIETRHEPVIGSWFRLMVASSKRLFKGPLGQEMLLTATHVADSHLVQAQDAYVTATLLQNVGPVLQALQPTQNAVVRAGALLIVKVDWLVQVHQLTAAQQAILDHHPELAASPREIIAALTSPKPASQEANLQSQVPQLGTGTTTANCD